MSIYAIGDTHLSFGTQKPMDIFTGWENYTDKLRESWTELIKPEDTVVLVGDISWGMTMEQSLPDFRWIDELPGKKLVLKGNHDYWWGSVTSMKNFFLEHEISTIDFLHNNSFEVEGVNICGSRGWLFEDGKEHSTKIINREAMRIELSLQSTKNKDLENLVFLHHPPIYLDQRIEEFIDVMKTYSVTKCYYGHIHGKGHNNATIGMVDGIEYIMISADYLGFKPLKIV